MYRPLSLDLKTNEGGRYCKRHLVKNLIFGRGRISKKGIEKVLPVVTDNTIHKERFLEPTHCMH